MKQILESQSGPTGRADRYAEMAAQAGNTDESLAEFREAANLLKASGRTDEFTRVAERILYTSPTICPSARIRLKLLGSNNARAALARLKPVSIQPERSRDPRPTARCFRALVSPHRCLPVLKELCRLYANTGRAAERNQEPSSRALAIGSE